MPSKTCWVVHPPPRFSHYFSFILKGRGIIVLDRGRSVLRPPCVIFSEANTEVKYGPVQMWEEMIASYNRELIDELYRKYPAIQHQCVWGVRNRRRFKQVFALARAELARSKENGWTDRVDRICDWLIVESLFNCQSELTQIPVHPAIQAITQQINNDFTREFDFKTLSQTHGLSYTNFRRLWNRYIGMAPVQYVLNLRLQEACRLLRQESLRISEVSERVGFHDSLYFSRRFRQFAGLTATQFRSALLDPMVVR
ncbi:MAG: AraC family transcriptional regulator [Kiritimatiellae bacterium]|nr:AraC family transcriptional regulator [Kiritimatiellia bacterium]